jgi:Tol biopolymer transport system component
MWQELHTTDSRLSPGESIDWLNSMISWLSPSRWFTVLVTASAAAAPEGATVMNGITAPAVSPDGKRMVFEWIDDLWTSSTEGGEAVRLVDNPARDAFPQWTPDGSRIVFSSDRSGSLQVYSIPASGGETLQHTDHSQGNELECLSPDGSHALVRGLREVSGPRATVLLTINLQNEEREQRVFTAPVGDGAAWSPDGNQVLFCKGGEALHRKGYRGSRASQIWRFDLTTESFTQLTTAETESRAPLWHSDGQGFYFLSAETGTLNLWTKRFTEPTAKALTHFSGDGIFMGQPAADGSVFVLQRSCCGFNRHSTHSRVRWNCGPKRRLRRSPPFRTKSLPRWIPISPRMEITRFSQPRASCGRFEVPADRPSASPKLQRPKAM